MNCRSPLRSGTAALAFLTASVAVLAGLVAAPASAAGRAGVVLASGPRPGRAFGGQDAAMSADARYIAFLSDSRRFVAGDKNRTFDVFVKDMQTNAVQMVDVTADGKPGQGLGYAVQRPAISADGRVVAFVSTASDLVPGVNPTSGGLFVRDLTTGTTVLASVKADGTPSDYLASNPSISGDGTRVAFQSADPALVAGDANGTSDVFVRDLTTGITTLASATAAGTSGDGASEQPSLAEDGETVAFLTAADDLAKADRNGAVDVAVRDLDRGRTVLASRDAEGVQATADSYQPALSPDGRFVAFATAATLHAADTNGDGLDVYLAEPRSGTIVPISVGPTGETGSGDSGTSIAVAASGRYVAFSSLADDLVVGDDNGLGDMFVRDVGAGTTVLASATSAGVSPTGSSLSSAGISRYGTYVSFVSTASDLAAHDTNRAPDVFRRRLR